MTSSINMHYSTYVKKLTNQSCKTVLNAISPFNFLNCFHHRHQHKMKQTITVTIILTQTWRAFTLSY